MSKCISSHGEYSEHVPGDPCPWCGEYDTERIIAERDAAEARIQAVRDVHRHITVETRGAIEPEHRCLDCCLAWPCPTIRALDGER